MIVKYHRVFDKEAEKLDQYVIKHFKERRNLFLINPSHPLLNNHPLHPPFEGSRSINVTGDYRAVFKYLEPEVILFTRIGTHHQLFGK